jgi:hypothetical protein
MKRFGSNGVEFSSPSTERIDPTVIRNNLPLPLPARWMMRSKGDHHACSNRLKGRWIHHRCQIAIQSTPMTCSSITFEQRIEIAGLAELTIKPGFHRGSTPTRPEKSRDIR